VERAARGGPHRPGPGLSPPRTVLWDDATRAAMEGRESPSGSTRRRRGGQRDAGRAAAPTCSRNVFADLPARVRRQAGRTSAGLTTGERPEAVPELSIVEAIRDALSFEMERDERVILLGLDVGPAGRRVSAPPRACSPGSDPTGVVDTPAGRGRHRRQARWASRSAGSCRWPRSSFLGFNAPGLPPDRAPARTLPVPEPRGATTPQVDHQGAVRRAA